MTGVACAKKVLSESDAASSASLARIFPGLLEMWDWTASGKMCLSTGFRQPVVGNAFFLSLAAVPPSHRAENKR